MFRQAYFPFGYFTGFLDFLRRRADRLQIITYRDLQWGGDFDSIGRYPGEQRCWKEQAKRLAKERRALVLIQHDVDARPERTLAALREERDRKLPSNVMIFRRRVDGHLLKDTGMLAFTEYALDHQFLKELEGERFVIGYHSNAMEQALWDRHVAEHIFLEDLAALRASFDVDFFSPHGGVIGPGGTKNRDLEITDASSLGVRWVHNGRTPRFTASYSDGGLNGRKLDPATRDLRDFVRTWEPGGRYRVLLHPQYYTNEPYEPAPRLVGTAWYDDLLQAYSKDPGTDSWADVEIQW
ncbi:MAG: hypothetical protein ACREXM_06855 [Gammaproteobacteria bacterium]